MTLLQAKCSINSLRYGSAKDFWITMIGENASSFTIKSPQVIAGSDNSLFFVVNNEKDAAADELIIGRINKNGTLNWAKTIASIGVSITSPLSGAQKIICDSSNNVYICGQSLATYGFVYGVNSSGTKILGKEYYLTSNTVAASGLAFASSDFANIYIALGETSQDDNAVAKISATTGAISWQSEISGDGGNALIHNRAALAVDNSYKVFLLTIDGTLDEWILAKFASTGGSRLWAENFDFGVASNNTYPGTMISDSSGNLVFSAWDGSNGFFHVAKVDATSDTTKFTSTWARKLSLSGATGTTGQQIGTCVDSQGNIYTTCSIVSGANLTYIVKYNSSGTIQWQRSFMVQFGATAKDVTQGFLSVDSEDNLIFTARYQGNIHYNNGGHGQWGYLVAKLPNDGSGTGAYTIGPALVTYAASSLTDTSASITKKNSSLTATTVSYLTQNETYTNTSATLLETKVKVS